MAVLKRETASPSTNRTLHNTESFIRALDFAVAQIVEDHSDSIVLSYSHRITE